MAERGSGLREIALAGLCRLYPLCPGAGEGCRDGGFFGIGGRRSGFGRGLGPGKNRAQAGGRCSLGDGSAA